jgi:hypothetical protein
MDLRDIGIKKDSICEAIVTTFHKNGTPNAAPMGILGIERNTVMLKVHKSTDTYVNILRSRCCVINFVFDPLLFLKCALYGKHKGPSEIELQGMKKAYVVEAPYLEHANAYVEAELEKCEEVRKRDEYGSVMVSRMTLKAKNIKILAPFPVAPNRGLFAGIELAIALSRGMTKDVQGHVAVIKKTLPHDESKRIEEFVNNYLRSKS